MARINCKTLGSVLALLGAFGVSGSALAASASGTANATVLAPIAIAAGQTLEFGTFAGNGAGTVVVSTAGARSFTGSVVGAGGTVRQGQFSVTGTGAATFAITYPGSVNLTSGANTMALQVSGASTGTLSSGSATVNVGGELTVAANQAAGSYTGTYSITVEYN